MKVKLKVEVNVIEASVIRPCSCGKEPGGMLELQDGKIVIANTGDEVKACTNCGEPIVYPMECAGLSEPSTILPAPTPA